VFTVFVLFSCRSCVYSFRFVFMQIMCLQFSFCFHADHVFTVFVFLSRSCVYSFCFVLKQIRCLQFCFVFKQIMCLQFCFVFKQIMCLLFLFDFKQIMCLLFLFDFKQISCLLFFLGDQVFIVFRQNRFAFPFFVLFSSRSAVYSFSEN